jgi:TRAP transporter TAXI family solute receptor
MFRPDLRKTIKYDLSPRLTILFTITSFLLVFSLIVAIDQFRVTTIRVGSGIPGGTLAEITPSVVEILNTGLEGARFEIVDSLGTRENIKMLKSGRIDIAIIYEGIIPRTMLNSELRTFARLYVNPLHVIASKASGITKFDDINREHRIGIPPKKAASYKRSNDVLGHYGIYDAIGFDVLEFDNFLAGAHMLRTGNLDIAFFGGAIPIPSIENYFVEDARQFRFIPIDASKALSIRYPYTVSIIPAMSYMGRPPFPRDDIVTIASVASLVGRADLEESLEKGEVYKMTKALFDSRSYLINQFPYLSKMSERFSSEKPEHPLFDGSADYYNRNQPIVWDAITLYISTSFSLIFLVLTLSTFIAGRREAAIKQSPKD